MSLSNPMKLTIAIPTYNRPEAIQKQVRNLLPQLREGVQLIVYDNASEIPVQSLFTEEEKRLFAIHRNPVNVGAEANICKCFEACCNSEWGFIPGDDDELYPDAVFRILKQMEKYPDAVFINFGCEKDEILDSEEACLLSLADGWESFGNTLWLSKGVYHTGRMHESYYELNVYSYTFM